MANVCAYNLKLIKGDSIERLKQKMQLLSIVFWSNFFPENPESKY